MKELTKRENEIIYFVLSRALDDSKDSEFSELDKLRNKFREKE